MAVIDDSRIRGVALTGGVAAARDVAERAGRNFRKSTMEMGGSDAFIVLEDADLDLTLKWAMWVKMKYMGKCCIPTKRFIIMESVADRFLENFKSAMAELKPGDPMDKNTKMMSDLMRREIRLATRPGGVPDASNLKMAEVTRDPLEDQQLPVRNRFMSVDP